MNLHVHSIMWNEARILPYWLRHYEQLAERIFVWDAQSDDGTREMLEAHPLVTVFEQQCAGLDDNYFTECFLEYKRLSADADWCACVAADEFIHHPQLLSTLATIETSKVQLAGYTMYAQSFPTTIGQIYDEVRLGYPDLWSCKTVLFRPQHEMQWVHGLHKEVSPTRAARGTGIKLLHYRYLGADYYVERTRRNYERWKVAGIDVEFDPQRQHNLPDGTRGNPYRWYEDNVGNLQQVVD